MRLGSPLEIAFSILRIFRMPLHTDMEMVARVLKTLDDRISRAARRDVDRRAGRKMRRGPVNTVDIDGQSFLLRALYFLAYLTP
jgi:hypothetical protein